MSAQPDLIRERETVGCPRCGRGDRVWDHGIPIDELVAAIVADPKLLETMGADSCPGCGGPLEWDAVTSANRDRVTRATRAAGGLRRTTLTLISAQLALGRKADAIASWIRAELGVVGIVVEGSSPAGRRLGYDCTGRPPLAARDR